MNIPTVRAFLAGNSGSGKTTRAWTLYLSRFPRRIIVDQTSEWRGRADLETMNVGAAVDGIRRLANRKSWTVIYTADDDRFPDFVRWLIPVPNLDQSPIISVGGAAILVDEVDLLAPGIGSPPVEIRTFYRRSRHVGLSIVSATQRPANVSREVTAQSTQIVAHYLSEPRDRDYMADVMRWTLEEEARWLLWCRLHPHGAVWKEVQTGRYLWLPERGGAVSFAGASAQLAKVQLQGKAPGQEKASVPAPDARVLPLRSQPVPQTPKSPKRVPPRKDIASASSLEENENDANPHTAAENDG